MSNAVSDTGPPLHLAEIRREQTLEVLDTIYITPEVTAELTRHGVFERVAAALGDRLTEESVGPDEVEGARVTLLSYSLQPTDLSIAALAHRVKPDVVLSDDLGLRRALESEGHLVVGSVGILIRAFRAGRLARLDLDDAIDRLFDGSSLYLSPAFRTHVRRLLADLGGSDTPTTD